MSQAIRFKTISLDPAEAPSMYMTISHPQPFNIIIMANTNIIAGDSSEIDGQFEAFYNFLKESYPMVFNQRSLVPIAFDPVEEGNPRNKSHSILLKWQGTNPSLLPVLLASHMGKPKIIHVLM